jgi:soluble lytic murein transglycosylase-like protein
VISYFLDVPGSGLLVVKTSESPDVQWGAPELRPEKLAQYQQMVTHWTPIVDDAGVEFRMPSNEIFAIMWSESGGLPNLTSKAGAKGLMQVMPFNFAKGTSDAQMFDPKTNVRAGVKLLAASHSTGHDLVQMASWYNAGGKSGDPWTNESWLAAGRNPVLTTRWGYPSQPGYIDSVVAAFNTGVKLKVA